MNELLAEHVDRAGIGLEYDRLTRVDREGLTALESDGSVICTFDLFGGGRRQVLGTGVESRKGIERQPAVSGSQEAAVGLHQRELARVLLIHRVGEVEAIGELGEFRLGVGRGLGGGGAGALSRAVPGVVAVGLALGGLVRGCTEQGSHGGHEQERSDHEEGQEEPGPVSLTVLGCFSNTQSVISSS